MVRCLCLCLLDCLEHGMAGLCFLFNRNHDTINLGTSAGHNSTLVFETFGQGTEHYLYVWMHRRSHMLVFCLKNVLSLPLQGVEHYLYISLNYLQCKSLHWTLHLLELLPLQNCLPRNKSIDDDRWTSELRRKIGLTRSQRSFSFHRPFQNLELSGWSLLTPPRQEIILLQITWDQKTDITPTQMNIGVIRIMGETKQR